MLPKIADKLFISDYPQIIAGIGCFVESRWNNDITKSGKENAFFFLKKNVFLV